MRYLSLGSIAVLAFAVCGCQPFGNKSSNGAVCPHCGKRHAAVSVEQATVGIAAQGLALVKTSETVADYAGDYGPAQVFEVTRPAGTALKLGRIWPSCTCMQVVSGSGMTFAADQPARIVGRQVEANASGQIVLYVQVLEPSNVLLSIPVSVKR